LVGSLAFFEKQERKMANRECVVEVVEHVEKKGMTAVLVSTNESLSIDAIFGLRDTIRPEASAVN